MIKFKEKDPVIFSYHPADIDVPGIFDLTSKLNELYPKYTFYYSIHPNKYEHILEFYPDSLLSCKLESKPIEYIGEIIQLPKGYYFKFNLEKNSITILNQYTKQFKVHFSVHYIK